MVPTLIFLAGAALWPVRAVAGVVALAVISATDVVSAAQAMAHIIGARLYAAAHAIGTRMSAAGRAVWRRKGKIMFVTLLIDIVGPTFFVGAMRDAIRSAMGLSV